MSDEDQLRGEIEAKLEILRARAEAYDEFVSPPGQPPLLWQMVMLADAGFTVLPPVRDPDPDNSFPELTVAMTEVEWTDEHHCLVGGESFAVVPVPQSYHGHLIRPKRRKHAFYMAPTVEVMPMSYDVEHFRRRDLAVSICGEVRWRSRILVCA